MYRQINYKEAEELIRKTDLIVADVRDQASYDADHISGAVHLSVAALKDFCQTTNLDTPILVYCYHGVSSQAVAQHLIDQGFVTIYSLVGGFEVWRANHSTSNKK